MLTFGEALANIRGERKEFGKRASERDVIQGQRSITRTTVAKAFELAVQDFANRHGLANDHKAMARFLEEESEVANGLYAAYAVAPRDESAVTKAVDGEDAIETVQQLAAANVQKNAKLTPGQAVAKVFEDNPALYRAYLAQATVPVGPSVV